MVKKGLGKGISSLIGDYSLEQVVSTEGKSLITDMDGHTVVMLNIKKIESNPGQPRKYFDEDSLRELADSIKEQGVLQPILVEESIGKPDHYIIVAGERRFRAARIAGLSHIPSLIKNFSEEQRLEVALIENLQRENLNPIEEAQAFRFLIEQAELSQDELARRIGKKRSTIANSVRLLNLTDDIRLALERSEISAGHGRALLSVVNPADQEILFKRIIGDNLSVRQSEDLAKELNNGSRAGRSKGPRKSKISIPEFQFVEDRFLEILGTKVNLKGSLGKGKIEISYYSPEDLERVYKMLGGNDNLFSTD